MVFSFLKRFYLEPFLTATHSVVELYTEKVRVPSEKESKKDSILYLFFF